MKRILVLSMCGWLALSGLGYSDLISGVTASASHNPFAPGRGADRMVDGSGLNSPANPDDPTAWTHTGGENEFGDNRNYLADARAGQTVVDDKWVAFDLGSVQELSAMNVFNFGVSAGVRNQRGTQNADVYYRSDSLGGNANNNNVAFDATGWTAFGSQVFTIGPTDGLAQGADTLDMSGITARYIAIDINTNHGDSGFVGLGEVQFFNTIPEPGSGALLSVGLLLVAGVLRRSRR